LSIPLRQSEIILISPLREILIQTTGENARGVLVVVQTKEGAEAGEMELLNKILNSVQLDYPKDALLLHTTQASRFSLTALSRATQSATVLLFGGRPDQYGLHFRMEKYRPFEIQGLRGIWVDELAEIGASKELKTALWSGLKSIFL
jgi:hypothetical protein